MFHPTDLHPAVWALGLLILAGGCTTAPREWRVDPVRVSQTACGSWAQVKLESGRTVDGELLAVASTVLYLHDGRGFYSIPRSRVDRTVTIYADSWDATLGIWTGLGVLSTLTHGFLLFLTAPIWGVAGGSAIAAERSTGRDRQTIPPRERARFPQGLPESFAAVAERRLSTTQVDSTNARELAGDCPPGESSD